MLRRIINWLRKKLNQPVKFDFEKALAEAQAEAHEDLARLEDPAVAAEIALWETSPDPVTDGVGEHEDGRPRGDV